MVLLAIGVNGARRGSQFHAASHKVCTLCSSTACDLKNHELSGKHKTNFDLQNRKKKHNAHLKDELAEQERLQWEKLITKSALNPFTSIFSPDDMSQITEIFIGQRACR